MLAKFISNPREDSLTAAVFSHLLHLPAETFWEILRSACHSTALPIHAGEPLLVEAWPQWSAAGISDRERVIPDLFLRFADFDLIIEAKIHEEGTQYQQQWLFELMAYANEYGRERRVVRMIALGGIHSHYDATLPHTWHSIPRGTGGLVHDTHAFECPVYMCQWSTILLECQRYKRRLEVAEVPTSRTLADIRILGDLVALFERHGYRVLRWFDDFDFASMRLDDQWAADLGFLNAASYQFQPV